METDSLRSLERLEGVWEGVGHGSYPTIDSFRYRERLRFEFGPTYPLLQYEQRAVLVPQDEPSHWEMGFIRLLEDGVIELSNCQDNGRLEVLRGHLGSSPESDVFELTLDSVLFGNDERMSRSRRIFSLNGDKLSYVVLMATHTTSTPVLQEHLSAELQRAAG